MSNMRIGAMVIAGVMLSGCGGAGEADSITGDDVSVDGSFDDAASDTLDVAFDTFGDSLGDSKPSADGGLTDVLDDAGLETGTDTGVDLGVTDISIADAPATETTCQREVRALGVTFTTTSARGVVDALHISSKVGGVIFANGTATTIMGDPVACEFVKTLVQFGTLLQSKGFVRVGTLGSYCYRCCCAWSTTNRCRTISDPEPSCGTSGYSNHSWGRALDVRYLYKADGTRYDINDPLHFVMATDTCGAGLAAQKGISKELYQLACDATKTKAFSTVLTPNYNSAHRNHFHMDIGPKGAPTGFITRSWPGTSEPTGVDDAPVDGTDGRCDE